MNISRVFSFLVFLPAIPATSDAGLFDLCCGKDAVRTRPSPSSGGECCKDVSIRQAVHGAAVLTTAAHNSIVGEVVNTIPVVGPAVHAAGGIVAVGLTIVDKALGAEDPEKADLPTASTSPGA